MRAIAQRMPIIILNNEFKNCCPGAKELNDYIYLQDRFISEKEFIVYCVYLAFVFVQFVCNLFSDLKALGVDPFDDTYADKHFRTTERQPLLANGSAKADEPAGPVRNDRFVLPPIPFNFISFQDTVRFPDFSSAILKIWHLVCRM